MKKLIKWFKQKRCKHIYAQPKWSAKRVGGDYYEYYLSYSCSNCGKTLFDLKEK